MYYSCHCIKRNGLQHDCRRTGCGGEPACLHMPDPLCAPSQLARARGLADPGVLAPHMQAKGGGGGGKSAAGTSGRSGKRFIVCELKGISPDINATSSGKCCKCPAPKSARPRGFSGADFGTCILADTTPPKPPTVSNINKTCACKCDPASSKPQEMFVFDEKTINKILSSFNEKELAMDDDVVAGPGGRARIIKKPIVKEPCTRPGCVHWQPPPPCCWDAPCKADCFETPPGIQPGRNPLTRHDGVVGTVVTGGELGKKGYAKPQPQQKIKLLTPNYCTGCSGSGGGAIGAAGGAGGPAPGLPVLVMKLC